MQCNEPWSLSCHVEERWATFDADTDVAVDAMEEDDILDKLDRT